MNRKAIITLAIASVLLIGWGTTLTIDWPHGLTYECRKSKMTVQIGLRSDGMVVWRSITQEQKVIESVTNSPSEKDFSFTTTNLWIPYVPIQVWTNNYTNINLQVGTNVTLELR